MKKIFIALSLVVVTLNLSSQNGPPWKPTGNTASAGDFLGTTNNFPLLFYTNNTQQMSLGTNGVFSLNSLSGIGNRVLVADANGNLTALPTSVSNALTAWDSNGSNVFFNGGNLGIGTSSPSYKLDVIGDAHISNNLYVGGGIIVTDKLDASVHVKAGDVIVNNDLNVTGNSNFGSNLKIASLAGVGDREVIVDASGNLRTITPSSPAGPCFPSAPLWHIGGDNISTLITTTPNDGSIGTCDATDFILKSNTSKRIWIKPTGKIGFNINNPDEQFHFSNGNVRIDGSIGSLPTPGLYNKSLIVNGDVSLANYIPVGATGSSNNGVNGIEVLGGDDGTGTKMPTRRGITTDPNPSGSLNFYINSNQSPVGFNFKNGNGNIVLASIDANGKLALNSQNPTTDALSIFDISTGKTNFKVFTDGRVYGREMIVTLNNFPDYVFAKSYKLMPLNEVKAYTEANHRLPNMPSASEIEKNGANLGEIQRVTVEKVEELYKYIFELEAELKEIKKELTGIKNK